MKLIISNQGVQLALLIIAVGLSLTFVGEANQGALLIAAGGTYLVGKLQRRPATIADGEPVEEIEIS